MNSFFTVRTPSVTVLNNSPLWVAEYAGRTAYDSFDKSENILMSEKNIDELKIYDIDDSNLLNQLSWVYHHESVLEHINFSFLIEGMSRGVLQELARHRIASYTVRSTRYTMSDVLYIFLSSVGEARGNDIFLEMLPDEMFVLTNQLALETEKSNIYYFLSKMRYSLGRDEFESMIIPKSLINDWKSYYIHKTPKEKYEYLKQKTKRNVGDEFKFIVTDNWSVDLVMTMNLRSLKNFMKLRRPNSAYFQIRMIADEIYNAMPEKYQKLIWKN